MMPCSGWSVMPKGEGAWEKPYMSSTCSLRNKRLSGGYYLARFSVHEIGPSRQGTSFFYTIRRTSIYVKWEKGR